MPEDKIREGGREGEALRAVLKDDAAVAAAEVVFSRPQTKIGRHKKADHPNQPQRRAELLRMRLMRHSPSLLALPAEDRRHLSACYEIIWHI